LKNKTIFKQELGNGETKDEKMDHVKSLKLIVRKIKQKGQSIFKIVVLEQQERSAFSSFSGSFYIYPKRTNPNSHHQVQTP
jgi:hypothetical protein